jgi:hypothetical protein
MSSVVAFTAVLVSTISANTAPWATPLLVVVASVRAPTDAQYCRTMSGIAQAPAQDTASGDALAPTSTVSVLCSYRTVTWSEVVGSATSKMREGWFARKQEQWNRSICSDPVRSALARRGWRFVQNITFKEGNSFTMDATCT